ncbi:HPF/RaiA family ribosome-associated protein [Candidatus Dependentiae bacterium]|nr:HPF/RaiA family ribosome-associated protein [Candidatus Dependentiae bacterium]
MQKKIVFKGTDHSAPLEEYANQQLARIEQFLTNERTPIYIDLIIEPSKVHAHHKAQLIVKTPDYDRITSYEGPDFYDALDRVVDTMYLHLHEDKKRKNDDKKMVGRHEEFKKQR